MRIETSGDKSYRSDLYEDTGDALGEATKVGGIDAACYLALDLLGDPGRVGDRGALEELVDLLEDPRVPDDVGEEIAETLDDVDGIELEYRSAESTLTVGGRD